MPISLTMHLAFASPCSCRSIRIRLRWGTPRVFRGWTLRDPAAKLISHDTCSDSIANSFVLVFVLSSPHRGIALAAIPPSRPTSQCISTMRVQIAVNMHRIAKVVSALHIALHKSPVFNTVLVPSRALTSRDSHRGLQKYIASQTCIARFGEVSFCGVSHNHRSMCCKMGYRTDAPVWN